MADGTKIEWTDATWNPITGCSVVSPGCTNCYAMKLAGTRLKHHPSRAGLTRDTKAGPVWNGEVRLNEDWLDQPLRWKAPRMIFVCAHGDLFAEGVPDDWIDRVFAVMALAPQHTFQVLTKRAERMRDFCTSRARLGGNIGGSAVEIMLEHTSAKSGDVKTTYPLKAAAARDLAVEWAYAKFPNVWLGVSAEDQKRADERVPLLLDTPAAVRWVSAEPLLGPIDFTSIDDGLRDGVRLHFDALTGLASDGENVISGILGNPDPHIDWIVVGGESGDDARPMHPDWARRIRDQCDRAGVAFLFKQHGSWAPVETPASETQEDEELRGVGDMLDGQYLRRVGKKAAGRVLDGVTHDGYPEVRS